MASVTQQRHINAITIREAAERLGVTRQRMHKLIQAYGLYTEWCGCNQKVVPVREIERLETLRSVPGDDKQQ